MGGYLAWMEENRDRGYALYLAANEHGNEDDFTISTIRQMIRNEYPIAGSTPIDSALLCHLVLHLYSLSEDSSLRVQQHLNQIKITPSPLAGVLENEDEAQNIFSDIESTVSEAYPTKKRGRQVLDSWFSLFSSHLTSAVTLVTFDDWVKDTLLSLADEEMRQETQQESQISYTYISFPQKWLRTHQRNDPLLNKIAGKKLITLGC
ncbi:MAG: hypothetical protein C4582_02295 [Desulfobacteraceae bacterium]|nr:MAG: hypothetical protein C4582_02295 [Desulfobacteraceae bacterium]